MNHIENENISFIQKWEPVLDTTAFAGSGAACLALQGASFISPIGLGALAAVGLNSACSYVLGKAFSENSKTAQFMKITAQVTAIALLTFALPYASAALGAFTVVHLSLEMAIIIGIASSIVKIATFTTGRITSNTKTPTETKPKQRTLSPPDGKKITLTYTPPVKEKKVALSDGKDMYLVEAPQELKEEYSLLERITLDFPWKKAAAVSMIALLVLAPPLGLLGAGLFARNSSNAPVLPCSEGNCLIPQGPVHDIPLPLRPDFDEEEVITQFYDRKVEIQEASPKGERYSKWEIPLIGSLMSLGSILGGVVWYRSQKEEEMPALPPARDLPIAVPNPALFPKVPQNVVGIQFIEDGEQHQYLAYLNEERRRMLLGCLENLPAQPLRLDLRGPSQKMEVKVDGKTFIIRNPEVIKFIQDQLPLRLEAPAQEKFLEMGNDRIQPDWEGFETYVKEHCPGFTPERAKQLASAGYRLLKKFRRGQPVEEANKEEKLVQVCWALKLHAITKGQPFVEGTFDLADPGYRLFNFFYPILYGRQSSHYKTRAIASHGYKHFGFDSYELPAAKRTIMMGRIQSVGEEERVYLKMENWGANVNFLSDPRARENAHQVVFHSLEFFESQYKRRFGDVGGGLLMRKEHVLNADKAAIKGFIRRLDQEEINPGPKPDLNEWGISQTVPYFEKALESSASEELKQEIRAYLAHLERRYPRELSLRKGNEVHIGNSVNMMDSTRLIEEPRAPEIDDDFDLLDSVNVAVDDNWRIAVEQLHATTELGSLALIEFANHLNQDESFTFVPDFLVPAGLENAPAGRAKHILDEAIENSPNKPIFIPLILQSSMQFIPLLGGYFPDHVVMAVIDPRSNTVEYYNSQGGKLEEENRLVLGTNKSIRDFLPAGFAIKSNEKCHQTDYVNFGTHVCLFMEARKDRSFEDSCNTLGQKDVFEERLRLAKEIQFQHTPWTLSSAKTAEEAIIWLKHEPPRVYREDLAQLFANELVPYIEEGRLNRKRLFDQVNIDIKRGYGGLAKTELDGVVQTSAEIIHAQLIKEGIEEELADQIMSLFHQGVFADLQSKTLTDLGIMGFDGGFYLRGQGRYLEERQQKAGSCIRRHSVSTKEKTAEIVNYSELIPIEGENDQLIRPGKPEAYAIIETKITVDLEKKTVEKTWRIDEIIE